jgi:hypothetical protein
MAVKRRRRDVGRGNGTRVGGHCHWGGGGARRLGGGETREGGGREEPS